MGTCTSCPALNDPQGAGADPIEEEPEDDPWSHPPGDSPEKPEKPDKPEKASEVPNWSAAGRGVAADERRVDRRPTGPGSAVSGLGMASGVYGSGL